MSLQTFLLYIATWSLVAITPGPAVMCSTAQAARHGFRSSLAGIAGIQSGNFLFFVGIACGLGTLLATATTAFTVLRVVGAIYLFYLGLRLIVSTLHRTEPETHAKETTVPAQRSLFLQGALIQLTNPKALLFVSALLPQFIDPHRPATLQLAILVITTIAVDGIVLSSYAWLAHRGLSAFRTSRIGMWMERICGAALVFFGCKLLFARK